MPTAASTQTGVRGRHWRRRVRPVMRTAAAYKSGWSWSLVPQPESPPARPYGHLTERTCRSQLLRTPTMPSGEGRSQCCCCPVTGRFGLGHRAGLRSRRDGAVGAATAPTGRLRRCRRHSTLPAPTAGRGRGCSDTVGDNDGGCHGCCRWGRVVEGGRSDSSYSRGTAPRSCNSTRPSPSRSSSIASLRSQCLTAVCVACR